MNELEYINQFSFFRSYAETIKAFDFEKRIYAYEAIIDYVFFGANIPDLEQGTPIEIYWWFQGIKANLDSSIRNVINGTKGGRPRKNERKNEKNNAVKTPLKTPVESNRKEKEKDKGKDSYIYPLPLSLQGEKEPDAPRPDVGAPDLSPFTFAEVLECIEENGLDLTKTQARNFYNWMQKYNWTINGSRVYKLENALSGYAKKHARKKPVPEPDPDPEPEPEPVKTPKVPPMTEEEAWEILKKEGWCC